MEWKLWQGDEPPFFTQPAFFEAHPRIAGCHQIGYYERLELVASVVALTYRHHPFATLTDLGCGDGTLLNDLFGQLPFVKMWGYDLGAQNIEHAKRVYGIDARQADLTGADVELGECVLLTEVLEHMVDPHGFMKNLNARMAIVTSPSRESDRWHYEHHAWAWDVQGFLEMFERTGWTVWFSQECIAKDQVSFGPSGIRQAPSFQCAVLFRDESSDDD